VLHSPAVDDDGVFGPVGLLTDDVDELKDALDGVDRGDAVIRPGGVVQMEDVLSLVGLRQRQRLGLKEPEGFLLGPGGVLQVSELTYPSLNFRMIHSGDSLSDSISTLISPYITGSSVNGQ